MTRSLPTLFFLKSMDNIRQLSVSISRVARLSRFSLVRRSVLTFILIAGLAAGVFVWRQARAANTEKTATASKTITGVLPVQSTFAFSIFKIVSSPPPVDPITGTVISNHGNGAVLTSTTVQLWQNGSLVATTTSDATTGEYSFVTVPADGDKIAVFISTPSTERGATVTLAGSGGSIAGLDIYQDSLIVRSDSAAPITNSDLADAAGATPDADLAAIYTVAGGNLTTSPQTDILIWNATTFAPGGNVVDGGNWRNNGTFSAGSSTVTLNGTANQTIGGNNPTSFSTLTINPSNNSIVSLSGPNPGTTAITAALNINSGTFSQGASALDDFSVTTNTATVAANGTWRNLGKGDLTLTGNVANAGQIIFNANGTPCGDSDDVLIRSSVPGTQRTWSGAGTFSMTDVDVQDQKVPGLLALPLQIIVNDGTGAAANNTGWNFTSSCTGPYTWIGGANQDWQVPTNWSPVRAPATNDVLIFDGNVTPSPIVTNVPSQTIAALRLTNGVHGVKLSALAAPQTLTISGGTGSDFAIPAGTLLTLDGSNAITVSITSGAGQSTIGGEVVLQGGAHRLLGNAAGVYTFQNTSIFTTGAGFTGNPFGASTTDLAAFQSGSQSFFNFGNDPFGGDGSSVVVFNQGSIATFGITTAFSSAGRSYGFVILTGSQSYSGNGSSQVTIGNDLTIASGSSLTLSGTAGGDLNLLGNFTNNGGFDANGRKVKFQGGGATQTVNGSVTCFDVLISKSGGSVKVSNSLTINGLLSFEGTTDVLDIAAGDLTLNGTVGGTNVNGALDSTVYGGNLHIGGAGALGPLRYLGTQNLAALEVNRLSGSVVTFATGVNIGNASTGSVTLTNGIVDMGANTLSLATFPGITRTNGYVAGNLQKNFGALGNFTFAVGTANGYSPLDTNVTVNSGGVLTVKAVQGKYPKVSGTNALQRYWTLSGSGLTANLTFHYSTSAPNDVVGDESLYKIIKYDGSFTQFTPNATGANSAQDHFATLNNVSAFSDWTLAELASITPGTLQFVGAPYTDLETDASTHTKTITVSRTGGSDGALDVTYTTSAGTATAGSDYVETTGTLHWNDGESGNKTFDITVNGDTTYEANETVNITLSNPTDAATITPPNPTTLTITNDDPVPANATLVVNTTDDNDFGACVTAHCSLREAINAANSLPDANTINFNIPNTDSGFATGVYTIQPTTQLPTVLTNITIDGTSQATFGGDTNANGPEIVLNGSLAPGAVGLLVSGDNNTVKSLVVNGFGNGGILVSYNNDPNPSNNQILNNYVGTNAAGTAAVANTGIGIDIHGSGSPSSQAAGNTVQGNLTSGNTGAGLGFCDAGTTTVSGNFIGTDRTGVSDVHNGTHGVLFQCTGDLNNTLTSNTIAFNLGDGIRDVGVSSFHLGNKFSQNSIFDNGGLGINLIPNAGVDAVTPNDLGDGDTGANGLQNFPVITSAKVTGPTKTIKGTLNSIASQTFTIEFFANTACDSSTNGEGKTYLGSTPVTTDGTGNGSFTFHPATLAAGDIITATATDSDNNTSEFSACFTAVTGTPGTLQFSTANTNDTELDASTHLVTVTVTRTGGSDGAVSVHYATSDGTATASSDYDSASGDLNWPEDDSTPKTFDVTIHGDTTYEANETINLTLSNAQVASLGSPSSATITIINDDAPAATLAVNTTDDNDFGACLVVHCSLREAINAANFTSDANTINFNIPNTDLGFDSIVYTIKPTTQLPTVLTNITIDGTSQATFGGDTNPNGPEIVLNGSLSTGAVGLLISGDGNTVKSLVVNGFGNGGILVSYNNDPTPSNNQILNNYVGTNAAGTAPVANTGIGIDIHGSGSPSSQATGNTVQGNVTSGNTGAGLGFCDAGTTTVSGNFIGTDRTGVSDVHNGSHGVLFQCAGDLNNTLTSNTIAFNLGDGIRDVGVSNGHLGNKFSQNSIFENTGLGINLIPNAGVDAVTANDAKDLDTGANGLQNFPVVNVALVGGSNTISGTLNSTPGETFTIELYRNPTCDSSGNGEGKNYLGSATTTLTDGNGNATFSFVTTAVTAGEFITATATNASGNTSEFSACFQSRTFVAGTIEFAQANTNDTETSLSHTVNIIVNRTGGSDGAASVNYAVTDGTATTADNDYSVSPASGTFNWADGNSDPKTITITVNGDTKFETDETVIITLSGPTGAAISGTNPATLTIVNDDTQPAISIDSVTHSEGNSGTTDYDFTVSLSNTSYQTVTVNAATTNDTATTTNSDYTAVNTTLTFDPDQTTKHVHVLVNGDLAVEPDEQFFVDLSAQTNASITGTHGVGTIINDDTDVTVSVSPSSVAEDGATNLVYTFTRNPLISGPITVNFSVGGTADSATDYTQTGAATFGATSGTVIIGNGNTTATVTIDPAGDLTVEPDENVILTVTSGTGYNVGSPSSATGTITNDDTDIAVTVSPSAVAEDDPLLNPVMVYTFTRTGVTSGAITVNFSVSGTASFPSDYAVSGATSFGPTAGTVTFGDGVTSVMVTIDPNEDAVYELNETAILTVTSGTGYNPGAPASATGTINNNDTAPTLTIGDKIAFEGNVTISSPGPTTNFVFTVTRTGNTQVAATVNFATSDGTTNPATGGASCTTGVDYITQNGMLTFPASAGPNSQTITIVVCKDTTVESNETFFVDLSGETNATINDGQGRGTIQNDDSPGTVLLVNTTDDVSDGICDAHCTLRDAITALNGSVSPDAVGISFAIPLGDPRHFYYSNDNVAGQVTNDGSHVLPTSLAVADDSTIVGIDPDWPHSWWSILPTSSLPPITHRVVVDGYTQTGATANDGLGTGDNAVLRIELNGASAGGSATGLTLTASISNLRGLAINRFSSHGLDLQGGTSNSVVGNFIGTDVSGTLDLGNTVNGISTAGNSLTIGGSTPGDVNLISGNNGTGIAFSNSNSDLVLGNLIGTKANVTSALGNGGNGISFTGAGSGFNTIGGTQPGDGNTILFNGNDGVQLSTSAGFGNAIRGNSIFSNGTTAQHLGIDLGGDGVTDNDVPSALDADTGANNLQNFPAITQALVTGSTKTIKGTLDSKASEIFDIDFYASSSCDTSGNGEGQTYLGSVPNAATDANGHLSFTFHPDLSHAPGMTVGKVITATATSTGASSSTSEFSVCFPVSDGSSGAGDIQFESATYTVAENVGGSHTADINLIRVGGSNGSISAQFTTSNGTATAGADYTNASQTVTFLEGEQNKTITVTITDDSIYEGNETVNLSLGSSSINAAQPDDAVAPAADPHAAVLTIIENDSAPTFAINANVTHAEGNTGTTSFVFTITKTGSAALNATVDYATVNGTATGPSDYTAIPATTLTFLPGETSKQITVLVNGDTTVEPDEAFTVHLSNAGNATIPSAGADGTGTITNDDTDVTLAVSPLSVAEDGAPNLVYTFSRTGVTASAQTVNFSVGGTATFATDYTQTGAATFGASSGTVTFGAGNTTATVTLDPAIDSTVEGNETVLLTVTSGTGYNVASPSAATGTITNDDTDVTLAVSPASVSEDGVANLVYTFTRAGVTTGALTVNFSVGGTATLATDYTQSGAATFGASSGTVTFGAGNSTATVTIDPTPDIGFESNETVILTVTAGTGYNAGSPSAATGTINNDDAAGGIIQFTANAYNTTENSRFVTITVQRLGSTSGAVTASYATPDDSEATTVTPCSTNTSGFASPRCDFTTALGTIRFADGDSAPKTFDILISQDSYLEPPELLTVTLSNLTGSAVFGANTTATVRIDDDDSSAPVSNPIDDPQNFVRQHYHDFLNREPDASGLAFWTNEITSCGSNQQCIDFKRVQVSAAFYLSIEFQDTGYLVERLYKSSYGDASGTSTLNGAHSLPVPVVRFSEFLGDTQEIGQGVVVGAAGWPQALENNKAAFADRFVQRARFVAAFPSSMTPAQFVDKLNLNAGGPLSQAERDQLVADLTSSAKTRAQVLRAVAEDQDLKNAEFNRAFVLMQYFGYLRRNANVAPDSDYSGYDFWLTKLNQFNGNFQNADMVKAFITSGEYRGRSGP
jgi:CSLREA domain-containing protein